MCKKGKQVAGNKVTVNEGIEMDSRLPSVNTSGSLEADTPATKERPGQASLNDPPSQFPIGGLSKSMGPSTRLGCPSMAMATLLTFYAQQALRIRTAKSHGPVASLFRKHCYSKYETCLTHDNTIINLTINLAIDQKRPSSLFSNLAEPHFWKTRKACFAIPYQT